MAEVDEFIVIPFNLDNKRHKELIEELEVKLKQLRMKYSYGVFE